MWMEPTSEQLMVEMGWVRRLARALVHDDTEADDVVQETWIVAAAKRPDEDRPSAMARSRGSEPGANSPAGRGASG